MHFSAGTAAQAATAPLRSRGKAARFPLHMSKEINTETAEKAAGFFSGLLTGWGVKAVWAKVIVGAVMGALAAAGIFTGGM